MISEIDRILIKNKIFEPCIKLSTNGIANDIYATHNYIIRIPNDHKEAISDALTESIAAPLAKSIGIKTPKLICFDDSYDILNKTYSIWERIHGLTLGELDNYSNFNNTWYEIGLQIGKLHVNVKHCDDPKSWLDNPDREYSKDIIIKELENSNLKSSYLLNLTHNKFTDKLFSYKKCFVHGDTNKYNFLCSINDELLSIIDWGDSGWADPAIDFYMIPIEVIDRVLCGYQEIAYENVDISFIYRIIFDKLWIGIEEKEDISELEKNIETLERNLVYYTR